MIYITGDTHIPIDIGKLNTKRFPSQRAMSKEDFVLICGDFGGVWGNEREDAYWLKWLENKSFTTLFIDGNHENFQSLHHDFEVVNFHGGKAHRIRDSIYHLMRGEIFHLPTNQNDSPEAFYRIFVMGGASSHDKEYRKEGKSWWPEELPSEAEYENGRGNLENVGYAVDFVFTHCCPTFLQNQISGHYAPDALTHYLEEIAMKVSFHRWYFGHYHLDKSLRVGVDKAFFAIYNQVVKLEK